MEENNRLSFCKGKEKDGSIDANGKNDVKEIFSKNWLTPDAMGYGNCVFELGPEVANRLNRQAVKSMAAIEVKRIIISGIPFNGDGTRPEIENPASAVRQAGLSSLQERIGVALSLFHI